MAVHYAGADSPQGLWQVLEQGQVATSEITAARLRTGAKDLHRTAKGSETSCGFSDSRYGQLDANTAPEKEHSWLLQLATEACQDANVNDMSRCGIVSGALSFPRDVEQSCLDAVYEAHLRGEAVPPPETAAAAFEAQDPASFVANAMGMKGPRYCIDAACASALYTLKLAQDHLLDGDAEVMLVGATCLPEPFFILTGFSVFQALPESHQASAPFAEGTAGLCPAEGGAVMVLKRLSAAERDGDRIYGTLLGVGCDNAGTGLPLKPHGPSELSCIERTHRELGVEPSSVDYVECHATGTPQGDQVELEALEAHFGPGLQPRIGSTKGNFGHSLVAAGFAGMAKLLLSLQHGILPSTPLPPGAKSVSPRVVSRNIPWPPSEIRLRRAGLSAFGFGGTNSHAVFEEYRRDFRRLPLRPAPAVAESPVAIVGIGARFGSLEGLDSFERAIYSGSDGAGELPSKRWRFLGAGEGFSASLGCEARPPRGCFVDSFPVDYQRQRLPMLPEDQLTPQHLLALAVIHAAIEDSPVPLEGGKVAVLVGMGTDRELYRHRFSLAAREAMGLTPEQGLGEPLLAQLSDVGTSTSYTSYIGNVIATRASSLHGLTGPSFTVNQGAHSVFRCLDIARRLLASGECTAAVVAGVDLCGSAEATYAKASGGRQPSRRESPTAPFDRASEGFFIGEGAGAVVLTTAAAAEGQRVYATLCHVAMGNDAGSAAAEALGAAHVEAGAVESMEVSYGPLGEALSAVYCQAAQEPSLAVGTAQATVGETGYASGMASLIKTALSLHHRYLPVLPRWTGPAEASLDGVRGWYTCPESRPWLNPEGGTRHAAVVGSEHRCHAHLILSDVDATRAASPAGRLGADPEAPKILTIGAASGEELVVALHEAAGVPFDALLGETLAQGPTPSVAGCGLVVCLVASPESLSKELALALRGVSKALQTGVAYTSPAGSYFTPKPLQSPQVAFVYGDGSSPYPGLGQDLYRVDPAMHESIQNRTGNLWRTKDEVWNTRATLPELAEVERDAFSHSQVDLFRSGVYHSVCFTDIARRALGIVPKGACGLSMGEVAMLFAFEQENTKQSNEMVKRLYSSSTWTADLSVRFNALREAWGIRDEAPVESFWAGFIVHAPAEQVRSALREEDRVRLILVNDASTCLVAGVPGECQALIAAQGWAANRVEQNMVGHCPEVKPYADAIRGIHDMLRPPCKDDVAIHVLAEGKLRRLGSDEDVAEHIAALYTDVADFPTVVEGMYALGYRVFVELGAGNDRTNAIGNILGDREHVAVAMDRRGQGTWVQLLRMLAVLLSHGGTGAHLQGLGFQPTQPPRACSKAIKQVTINGSFRLDAPLLPLAGGPFPAVHPSVAPEAVAASWEAPRAVCPAPAAIAEDDALTSSQILQEVEFQREQARRYQGPCVWDYDDLLEFAEGNLAAMYSKVPSGEHPPWELVDGYRRRVRLPMREYLLCSRVTHMDATTGCYEPCSMITEYDVPPQGALSEGGDVPWAVLVEAGQCDLLLISYLGIDFSNRGDRVYRLLDTTLTFFGVAQEGETLRYHIRINGYAKEAGRVSMFFFEYDCYVGDKLLIEMRNGVAGFFTDQELAEGKGVLRTAAECKHRATVPKRDLTPFRLLLWGSG